MAEFLNKPEMKDEILKLLHIVLPGTAALSIDSGTELMNTGIVDSFSFLELVRGLEEHFRIRIPEEELVFENFETLDLIEQQVLRFKLGEPAQKTGAPRLS